jgi:hypothetical protein
MFKKAVFGPRFGSMQDQLLNPRSPLKHPLGELAETIVFFDMVYIFGDAQHLASLIYAIGAESFLRLYEAGCINLRFSRGTGGYFADGDNSVIFQLPSASTRSDVLGSIKNVERSLVKMSVNRKLADKICTLVDYDNSAATIQDYRRGHTKLCQQARANIGLLKDVVTAILTYDTPHSPLPEKVITLAGPPYSDDYFKIDGEINYRSRTFISFGEAESPQSAESTYLRLMDTVEELPLAVAIESDFPLIQRFLPDYVTSLIGSRANPGLKNRPPNSKSACLKTRGP